MGALDFFLSRDLQAKAEALQAELHALGRSQAMISFDPKGHVLDANANFLKVLGYTIDEIRGRHHSMFIEAGLRDTPEYRLFWERLGAGQFDAGQYKRIGKDGKEVWIQASYNPVIGANGQVLKVVKIATDITAQTVAADSFQTDISSVIACANQGDFSARLDLSQRDGVFLTTAKATNSLMDVVEHGLNTLQDALKALAQASSITPSTRISTASLTSSSNPSTAR